MKRLKLSVQSNVKVITSDGQFQLTAHQSCRQLLVPRSLQDRQRCVTERLETNFCPTQAHVEIAVSDEVVWSIEHVMIPDGGHNDGKIKKNSTSCKSRSVAGNLEVLCEDGSPDRTVSGLTLASNQQKKMQQGAQQHVLLVEVCLETHPCPTQAHVEISDSVEVVWSLEYVLISDGGQNIKNNQEDRTLRERSVLLSDHTSKFAAASPLVRRNRGRPPNSLPFLALPTTPTTSDGWVTSSSAVASFDRQYGQLSVVASGAYSSTSFFWPAPLVCSTCPKGCGTTSSSSPSAWCGPAPVSALGHQRVPNRGAVDECSGAVILADVFLVADILVAVVDREIEASSGAAPEVVEVRDGCPRIVGDFRRVSVQQPVHQLVNQVDERRVLVSVKKRITNSNEQHRQVFALFHGEVALTRLMRLFGDKSRSRCWPSLVRWSSILDKSSKPLCVQCQSAVAAGRQDCRHDSCQHLSRSSCHVHWSSILGRSSKPLRCKTTLGCCKTSGMPSRFMINTCHGHRAHVHWSSMQHMSSKPLRCKTKLRLL